MSALETSPLHPSLVRRFHKYAPVGAPEECWLWTGPKSRRGYGRMGGYSRATSALTVYAHRVAFFLANGRWPRPNALHKCDTPACVNPAHIFEGTDADNVADMVSKNRQARGAALRLAQANDRQGEAHPLARLSEADVRAIRKLRFGQRVLASWFGISPQHVSDIRAGRRWRHIA